VEAAQAGCAWLAARADWVAPLADSEESLAVQFFQAAAVSRRCVVLRTSPTVDE